MSAITAFVAERQRALCALLLVVHALFTLNALRESQDPSFDFDRYYEIASATGRPYVDFQVEHAPGTYLLFRTLAVATGSRNHFTIAVVLVNVAADLVVAGALWWGFGWVAACAYAVFVLPVLGLELTRIDLWATAAATLGVAAWRRRHGTIAGACLALGGAFKMWPLVFGTWLLAPAPGRPWRPHLAALTAMGTVAALAGAWWWNTAGTDGLREVVSFRGAHGWQIESTIGSLIRLSASTPPAVLEAGAWRAGTMPAGASTLLFLIAVPWCAWTLWMAERTGRAGAGWIAAVGGLLVSSALFSAQYILWLIPGAAIAFSERNSRLALGVAVAVPLTGAIMSAYDSIKVGTPFGLGLVVVRNLLVFAVVLSAAATLIRTEPMPVRAE